MAPVQHVLGLPNHDVLSVCSNLRHYLRQSAGMNRSWNQRAWMVQNQLSRLVHWLRINGEVPDRHLKPWFKSYTKVWGNISEAYSVAKQISEGAYRRDPRKRRKLQERLSWEVSTALDAFEKFVTEEF